MQPNPKNKPVEPKEVIELVNIFKQLPDMAKAHLTGYGNGLLDGLELQPKKKTCKREIA